MALKKTVIYVENSAGASFSLCFSDVNSNSVFELTGKAYEQFSKLIQDSTCDKEYIEIFSKLGILENSVSNIDSLKSEELSKVGITLRDVEDMYSDELEAHGFTTLTATNCSSYCDCS